MDYMGGSHEAYRRTSAPEPCEWWFGKNCNDRMFRGHEIQVYTPYDHMYWYVFCFCLHLGGFWGQCWYMFDKCMDGTFSFFLRIMQLTDVQSNLHSFDWSGRGDLPTKGGIVFRCFASGAAIFIGSIRSYEMQAVKSVNSMQVFVPLSIYLRCYWPETKRALLKMASKTHSKR